MHSLLTTLKEAATVVAFESREVLSSGLNKSGEGLISLGKKVDTTENQKKEKAIIKAGWRTKVQPVKA